MVHVHEAAGNPGRQESSKAKLLQSPPATPAWSTPFPPVGIQCHSSKTCRPTSTQLVCSFQSLLFNMCLSTDATSWMGRSISKTSSNQSQNASLPWRHRKFWFQHGGSDDGFSTFWSFKARMPAFLSDAKLGLQGHLSQLATFTPWNHFTTRLSMPEAWLWRLRMQWHRDRLRKGAHSSKNFLFWIGRLDLGWNKVSGCLSCERSVVKYPAPAAAALCS